MGTVRPILRNGGANQVAGSPLQGGGLVPSAPSPGTVVNPTQSLTANPYTPVDGGVPTTTTGVTGVTPAGTVQGSGINWADGSNTVTGDFKDTYGAGTGTAITGVLQNLGTSTDNAVQALINNTSLAADKQFGNIQAQQAAAGITPDSSTAGLAAGDFYGTVNSNLQSTIAGMEQQQEDTLLQALMGEGAAHGGDTSTLDSIGDALGSIVPGIASGASGVSSALSSLSPTMDTSWLDALGALV